MANPSHDTPEQIDPWIEPGELGRPDDLLAPFAHNAPVSPDVVDTARRLNAARTAAELSRLYGLPNTSRSSSDTGANPSALNSNLDPEAAALVQSLEADAQQHSAKGQAKRSLKTEVIAAGQDTEQPDGEWPTISGLHARQDRNENGADELDVESAFQAIREIGTADYEEESGIARSLIEATIRHARRTRPANELSEEQARAYISERGIVPVDEHVDRLAGLPVENTHSITIARTTPMSRDAATQQGETHQVPEVAEPTQEQIKTMDLVPYQRMGAGGPVWISRSDVEAWRGQDPINSIAIPIFMP